MDVSRVLAQFDQVRRQPAAGPGLSVMRDGGLVRIAGPYNFISAWDPDPNVTRPAVADLAKLFKASGERLIWRVYGHDEPSQIGEWLAAHGFRPSQSGTLMVFDLAQTLARPGAVEVRRVHDLHGLDDYAAAADRAFGDAQASASREAYAQRLNDPGFGLFVAYVEGIAAASARLELSGPFGQLFGGGVAPGHRGKGLYRALVAARAETARQAGLDCLITDARETSRPILERLGFTAAGREITWVLG